MEAGKDTVDTVGLITGENMMVDCGGGAAKDPSAATAARVSRDDAEQNSNNSHLRLATRDM